MKLVAQIMLDFCIHYSKDIESEDVFEDKLTIHLSREFANLLGQFT